MNDEEGRTMNASKAPSRIPGRPRGGQRGMSLIEVLVAILVVALGIMTMVVMQINSTKMTKTSEVRAMGALLVGDLADRMRANPDGFTAKNYQITESTAAPEVYTKCNTQACNAAELAQQDRSDWLQGIRFALPSGTARVSQAASTSNGADVWLIWIDPEERTSSSTPSPSQCPSNLAIQSSKAPIRCMYFRITI